MIQSEPHDEKTDIWSLGILLYEMLHGYAPFQGTSNDDMMGAIVEKDLQIQTPLTSHVKNLLNQLLNKDPEKRPSLEKIFRHQWITKLCLEMKLNIDDFIYEKPGEELESEIIRFFNNPFGGAELVSENIVHKRKKSGFDGHKLNLDTAENPFDFSNSDLPLLGGFRSNRNHDHPLSKSFNYDNSANSVFSSQNFKTLSFVSPRSNLNYTNPFVPQKEENRNIKDLPKERHKKTLSELSSPQRQTRRSKIIFDDDYYNNKRFGNNNKSLSPGGSNFRINTAEDYRFTRVTDMLKSHDPLPHAEEIIDRIFSGIQNTSPSPNNRYNKEIIIDEPYKPLETESPKKSVRNTEINRYIADYNLESTDELKLLNKLEKFYSGETNYITTPRDNSFKIPKEFKPNIEEKEIRKSQNELPKQPSIGTKSPGYELDLNDQIHPKISFGFEGTKFFVRSAKNSAIPQQQAFIQSVTSIQNSENKIKENMPTIKETEPDEKKILRSLPPKQPQSKIYAKTEEDYDPKEKEVLQEKPLLTQTSNYEPVYKNKIKFEHIEKPESRIKLEKERDKLIQHFKYKHNNKAIERSFTSNDNFIDDNDGFGPEPKRAKLVELENTRNPESKPTARDKMKQNIEKLLHNDDVEDETMKISKVSNRNKATTVKVEESQPKQKTGILSALFSIFGCSERDENK